MKRQGFLFFVFPAALSVVLVGLCVGLQDQGTQAHDGSGPDPRVLLALLLAWGLGIGLACCTLYAVLTRAPRRLQRVAWHAAMWLGVGVTLLSPSLRDALSLRQVQRSPEWQATDSVAQGRLEDIQRLYPLAHQQSADPAALDEAMLSAALQAYRLDVLAYLKTQGVVLARAGAPAAWSGRVLQALRARGQRPPQAQLDLLRWLLAEGDAQGLSLGDAGSAFADVDLYFSAYRDIDAPATREVLRLLVAHGADVVGCTGQSTLPCPLVYLAGKGMTPSVRYLLAQGANPDSTAPDGSQTALSAAIGSGNPQTLQVLLAAGARVRLEADHNDLVEACASWPGQDAQQHRRMLDALFAAHLRLQASDLARYQGPLADAAQRACVARFIEAAAH